MENVTRDTNIMQLNQEAKALLNVRLRALFTFKWEAGVWRILAKQNSLLPPGMENFVTCDVVAQRMYLQSLTESWDLFTPVASTTIDRALEQNINLAWEEIPCKYSTTTNYAKLLMYNADSVS